MANVVSQGEAKHLIAEGCVKVNGEIETKRGRKITKGDIIELKGNKSFKVI